MSTDDLRGRLLEQLRANWATSPLGMQAGEPADGVLGSQVAAFEAGRAASFPYFVDERDEVTWFTVAPCADSLRMAIEDLRAWLFPNHAAELRVESGSSPGDTGLRPLIFAASPAGYFVWKTRREGARATAARLTAMYELMARRPRRAASAIPTLYELRQRFRTALVVGDRPTAEAAIDLIAREALDSATNVAFMRVKLADHFGEHAFLARWDAVRDLAQLRLPAAVRSALVRAFYRYHLSEAELAGDLDRAAHAYAERVDPALGPVLDVCRAEDGPEVARCLAYRFRLGRVSAARLEELRGSGDEVVARILGSTGERETATAEPPASTESAAMHAFDVATQRGDQRAVQEFGELILAARWEELGSAERTRVAASITDSLRERANPRLSALLSRVVGGQVVAELPPQDWTTFLDACTDRDWARAHPFIERADRPAATADGPTALRGIIARLQSLPTETGTTSSLAQAVVIGALTAVIEDCRTDLRFPRTDLVDVYSSLLELLTFTRGGSTQHEDASLFLLLADAVLQVDSRLGRDVASLAESWWTVRPSEALLPFLLDVLSILSFHGTAREEALALWVRGADLIRTETIGLGPGEHSAWSSVGTRLGVAANELAIYLGTVEPGASVDPLTEAGLKKVAIVSLRQRQAQEAARMIRSRCGAEIVLVDETDTGPLVRSARNADVILVVWSAISHAVFRGLDPVRERVAYVQGTGAESIVLSLERAVRRFAAGGPRRNSAGATA